jgi:hypothetical protein
MKEKKAVRTNHLRIDPLTHDEAYKLLMAAEVLSAAKSRRLRAVH